ncbi:MAG TPA: hypothetical protein VMC05_08650 [Xanthobacteraceae bacterium]|nr:hypothetical protein [Xanthobacteraceae bacterium]
MALLDALFGLWLAAGILSFIVGGVSAILRRLGASVSSRWVLPFYLLDVADLSCDLPLRRDVVAVGKAVPVEAHIGMTEGAK